MIATAAAQSEDQALDAQRLASAREQFPEARLVTVIHHTLGLEFLLAVPPTSPWHELTDESKPIHINAEQSVLFDLANGPGKNRGA